MALTFISKITFNSSITQIFFYKKFSKCYKAYGEFIIFGLLLINWRHLKTLLLTK